MNLGLRVLVVAVLAEGLLSGCAKPGLQGQTYYGEYVTFEVGPIPAHWRSVDSGVKDETIAALAFRSDPARATVGVTGRCNRDGDDVPLRALTQHLYIGFTQRELQKETLFELQRREALRTEMSAALDGVKKHMVFVVLKRDGCVYDFWRIGDLPTSTTPEFDEFVQGFRALKP